MHNSVPLRSTLSAFGPLRYLLPAAPSACLLRCRRCLSSPPSTLCAFYPLRFRSAPLPLLPSICQFRCLYTPILRAACPLRSQHFRSVATSASGLWAASALGQWAVAFGAAAPTDAPTAVLTASSTAAPTDALSVAPTAASPHAPTVALTVAPTVVPTDCTG